METCTNCQIASQLTKTWHLQYYFIDDTEWKYEYLEYI